MSAPTLIYKDKNGNILDGNNLPLGQEVFIFEPGVKTGVSFTPEVAVKLTSAQIAAKVAEVQAAAAAQRAARNK